MSTERIAIRRTSFVSAGKPQEDIIKLLDGLEECAENAYSLFGKAWGLDLEEFHMHTNKIRASLPDEMRRASRLAIDSDQIVTSARDEAMEIKERSIVEANRVMDEARQMAAKLIDNSEINRLAKSQAQEIMMGAEIDARDVRRGADEYAREVLSSVENHLAKVMGTLQKGREKLDTRIAGQQPAESLTSAGRGVRR